MLLVEYIALFQISLPFRRLPPADCCQNSNLSHLEVQSNAQHVVGLGDAEWMLAVTRQRSSRLADNRTVGTKKLNNKISNKILQKFHQDTVPCRTDNMLLAFSQTPADTHDVGRHGPKSPFSHQLRHLTSTDTLLRPAPPPIRFKEERIRFVASRQSPRSLSLSRLGSDRVTGHLYASQGKAFGAESEYDTVPSRRLDTRQLVRFEMWRSWIL
jgi:hypothetical protein